jgi:hypothetical protein
MILKILLLRVCYVLAGALALALFLWGAVAFY